MVDDGGGRISLGAVAFILLRALNLRPRQHEATFKGLEDVVVDARAPILSDNLARAVAICLGLEHRGSTSPLSTLHQFTARIKNRLL
jgi:hypothetical protein